MATAITQDRKLLGSTLLEMFEKQLREGEYFAPFMREIPSLEEVEAAEQLRSERSGELAEIGMTHTLRGDDKALSPRESPLYRRIAKNYATVTSYW